MRGIHEFHRTGGFGNGFHQRQPDGAVLGFPPCLQVSCSDIYRVFPLNGPPAGKEDIPYSHPHRLYYCAERQSLIYRLILIIDPAASGRGFLQEFLFKSRNKPRGIKPTCGI